MPRRVLWNLFTRVALGRRDLVQVPPPRLLPRRVTQYYTCRTPQHHHQILLLFN